MVLISIGIPNFSKISSKRKYDDLQQDIIVSQYCNKKAAITATMVKSMKLDLRSSPVQSNTMSSNDNLQNAKEGVDQGNTLLVRIREEKNDLANLENRIFNACIK